MERKLLKISAWAMLGAVAIGYVSTVPAVNAYLDELQASTLGKWLISLVLLLVAADALLLWISAVSYAWASRTARGLPRWPVVVVLVIGNFVSAFFYYFLFVARERAGIQKTRTAV
jgi:hypothetical protein